MLHRVPVGATTRDDACTQPGAQNTVDSNWMSRYPVSAQGPLPTLREGGHFWHDLSRSTPRSDQSHLQSLYLPFPWPGTLVLFSRSQQAPLAACTFWPSLVILVIPIPILKTAQRRLYHTVKTLPIIFTSHRCNPQRMLTPGPRALSNRPWGLGISLRGGCGCAAVWHVLWHLRWECL